MTPQVRGADCVAEWEVTLFSSPSCLQEGPATQLSPQSPCSSFLIWSPEATPRKKVTWTARPLQFLIVDSGAILCFMLEELRSGVTVYLCVLPAGAKLGCCCFSVPQLCLTFATQWMAAGQAYLSFTISRSLLKFMSIELVMTSNHHVLCGPLLLPSIFPSIRVFSNEMPLHIRWPKYIRASVSVLPKNIQDWFPLRLTGWISSQSKRLSKVFSNTTVWKYQFFSGLLYKSHIHTWLLEKP